MQISPSQLDTILTAPLGDCPVKIIWLEGKEPLLIQETRDRILGWAQKQIEHRQLHQIDQGFNWDSLIAENASFGLFDESKIYDLRFMKSTFKSADFEQVCALAKVLDDQKFVIISSEKLEKKSTSLKAFKQLNQWLGLMTFWPLPNTEYPKWIKSYCRKISLKLEPDTLAFLAGQHEGNLLALKQTLDRLAFTSDNSKSLSLASIEGTTVFQVQYSTFDLVDYALAGQGAKSLRGLAHVKSQGIEPILVLWALNNAFEAIAAAQQKKATGQVPWPQFKIFGLRIGLFERAAKRITTRQRQAGLELCGNIDGMIKGVVQYDVWLALEQLIMHLAQPDSSMLKLSQSPSFAQYCSGPSKG